ncbi:hsp70 family chaperone [Fusarium pseudoanthophilum]|uniref:Hsp70 family chaperone n=1 Tax=Fusarium pseudoanthophilum TaxID=48495 RepID=A0A8H5UPV1_9HYPO|nr:hsp70 family chaperone [Fusarium pseudoanthophilum]
MPLFRSKSQRNLNKDDSAWSLKNLVDRVRKKNNSNLDDLMIIGIDFGTTYSGAAWATVADIEVDGVNVITSWPDTGAQEGKAPTELFYEHGKTMWGYEIPREADPVRWFKLLLLKDEDQPSEIKGHEYLVKARNMLADEGKSTVDAIADYLHLLWDHVLKTIIKARGKNVVEALCFHVVITVPAIWKNYARDAMLEAAQKAGITATRRAGATTISFAPEPEAAALASICERAENLAEGDVFVICDAGGGTVDLISYKVENTDPVALQEAVVGSGGLCGGIFIDQEFQRICKARLGRDWSSLSQRGISDIMKDEWEHGIKRHFKPVTSSKEFIVKLPGEVCGGSGQGRLNDSSKKPIIKDGRIHFSRLVNFMFSNLLVGEVTDQLDPDSEDIEQTFNKSFNDIAALLDAQVHSAKKSNLTVKGIILVGGLGCSPYLQDYLKAKYKRKKIDVLQTDGMKPRTAICRGAVYKGLIGGAEAAVAGGPSAGSSGKHTRALNLLEHKSPVTITSTLSRLSLGVTSEEPFDEDVHSESDKYWDDIEGCYYVSGVMNWYIKKSQSVQKDKPLRKSFYRAFENRHEYEKFVHNAKEEILQCDHRKPPKMENHLVTRFCEIKISLTKSFEQLDDYDSPGRKRLKRIDFDIEMVPSGASVEFSVYEGDRKIGTSGMGSIIGD